MSDGPSKKDIEAIFSRLRAIPANKSCFDCGAKNPTWSSVTYGVFICIDCSAVHRGLGVHLTFVRSTQLDTNWTWLQLRQMQVGGNANATQFFSQHNCVTSDAQQKYNSRAAQLYREKLMNLAQQAIRINGEKLHLHSTAEVTVEDKEDDFFAGHDLLNTQNEPEIVLVKHEENKNIPLTILQSMSEPSINFSASEPSQERKPTIGGRKIQPKKASLGTRKGLGATKVKTDFATIEREAEQADENRRKALADAQQATVLSTEEKDKQMASMRLAYQDLSVQQKKQEDKIRNVDPRKAEQVERLGMGFQNRSGISHSVLSDMQTIEQENLEKRSTPLSKLMSRESDGFFDEFSFSSSFSMNRNSPSSHSSNKYGATGSGGDLDSMFMDNNVNIDWPEPSTPKQKPMVIEKEKSTSFPSSSDTDTAQKKFGSAKAISSEQFFNNGSENNWETKSNLNRFQDSTSISSADYFGEKKSPSASSAGHSFQTPDLDDVKESVRQGVTKVAGKLSSLANGVMSSIQDRYGY